MNGKIRTRRWTTTIVTVAVLMAGSATSWTAAAGTAAGPTAQRAPGAGGLASDGQEPVRLDPSLGGGGGAGGPSPSFGVLVSASPSQDDPTAQLPIEFEVEFEVPIDPATFDASDIMQDGTAAGIAWEIVNTGNDTIYQLRAVGVQSAGTISPSVPGDAVTGGNVATNDPSVGVGNTVVYSGAGVAAGPAYLYVGVWNPARVYTFYAGTPATLEFVGAAGVPDDVRDMVVDPTGTHLYYATGALWRFSLSTGAPTAQQLVQDGPGNIDSIAVNPIDSKLYATQNQGLLLVYDLPSGILVDSTDGLIAPRGVVVGDDARQVFVANGYDFMFSPGSQEIVRFGLANGLLDTGPFLTNYGPKPEHLAVDRCGEFLLHTQQPGHNVLTGDIGPTGAITSGGIEPAGPGALRLTLVPLGTTPCGDATLYVTNVLDDTVSVFHADGNGGLTFLEDEATGVRPEDLIKHPTANILYVLNGGDYTGQSSIWIYEIDTTTGELTNVGQTTIDQEGAFRLAIKDAS